MKQPAATHARYTPYHPKWYRRRMPIFWWLGRLSYVRFITRELTSLAVGYMALVLLAAVWALARGEAAWAAFLEGLAHPAWLTVHGVVAFFLLFHTVTWLGLAPKALVLKLGRRRLPDAAVVAAHYVAWAAASALVLAFFLRGTG